MEEKYWELSERYLNGNMSGPEARQFENELKNNPALLDHLLDQKLILQRLNEYAERKQLHQQLNLAHQNYQNSQSKSPLSVKFWKEHSRTIAVAASVSLLVVISSLLFIGYNNVQKKQTANFKAMRRDIDKIKKNQKALLTNLQNRDKKEELKHANFSGTGFALTVNGFFITSWHLIYGADSVFVQNADGNRFKAIPVFRDKNYDFAILKIESSDFAPLDKLPYSLVSDDAQLGEKVFTLGFPKEDVVYGEGTLSSQSGFEGDTGSYQLSIPVNPGNSGGPVFNEDGNIIGLISGTQSETQGVSFAVKSKLIVQKINEIQKDSLTEDFRLPKPSQNSSHSNRVNQLKKIKDYIVNIEVYNRSALN